MAKEMANMNQQGDLLEEKLVQVNRVEIGRAHV